MAESIRVLHVDDEEAFLDVAETFLERAADRLDVVTETSAAAGLERIRQEPVECVVSDYRMPDADGLAFLDAVREEHPDLPFILFTGRGSEAVASEAVSAGATDYLQKGGGTDQYDLLANRICNAVERYRAERERERSEAELRRSESLLDSIFEQVPIHLYVMDEEARYVRVSTAYLEERYDDYPLAEEDFLGKSDLEVFDGEFAREVHEDNLRVIEEGERIVDKEEYVPAIDEWNLTSKVPWRTADGEVQGLFGVSRKITERKRREEERRELNRRLEAVLDTVDAAIFMKDAEGRYRLVNDATLETLDREESEVIGATAHDLFEEEVADEIEADDRRILETGEPIRTEEEIEGPDGTRTHLLIKSPVFDDSGEVWGICAVSTDITEQVEARRRLERQNERLDELASIIGHDLRNPLNLLAGSLEQAEASGDPEAYERCRRMVDRIERLLDDLLTLARQGETIDEPERVQLSTVARSAWEVIEAPGGDLRVESDGVVEADEDRLRQLFENLLGNAVEHSSRSRRSASEDVEEHGGEDVEGNGRGGVTIRLGVVEAVDGADGEAAGGFFVADDGPGIPPEERDRVFQSGYSTSPDGTGFGLAIVEEVAEAHGWDVEVTESCEGGARFEVTGVDVDG